MKKVVLSLVVVLTLVCSSASATLIATQDFDGGTPTWSFVPDPAAGSFTSSSTDIWEVANSVGDGTDAITMTNNFWAARDVENGDNPRGPDGTLTFSSIDISTANSVSVSFDYEVLGYDGGDDLFYELFLDGIGQGEIQFVDGVTGSGGLDQSANINIPVIDSATSVGLVVRIDQNGGNDWAGLDNFQVNGTIASVPEPSAFLFGGLVCGLIGLVQVGRKRLSGKA